jgi:sulfoxide reductase catalytic subunit YedY
MLIKNRQPGGILSSEITSPEAFEGRRTFLKTVAASAAASVLPACGEADPAPDTKPPVAGEPGQPMSVIKAPYGQGLEPTSYEHVTTYNNFYEFGTGKGDPVENSASLVTRPWNIVVDGECENPGEIGIEDILSGIAQEERIYRFRCVEAWAMVVPWVGFSLSKLLQRFKPTSRAKYVYFETLFDPKQMPGQQGAVLDWPYREGLRIDEAMHPLSMLVTGVYGRELPNQNGAPLRLIVPWKYGFKSIKSIVRIRFDEHVPDTTWWKRAPSEYGFYANVNPKVDHPRWSQATHRNIGEGLFAAKHETLMFNGYADEVAHLYKGMDLKRFF